MHNASVCLCYRSAGVIWRAGIQDVQEMEGSKFKKLCADCGLVDKKFTVTDVDLTFSKVSCSNSVATLEDFSANC